MQAGVGRPDTRMGADKADDLPAPREKAVDSRNVVREIVHNDD